MFFYEHLESVYGRTQMCSPSCCKTCDEVPEGLLAQGKTQGSKLQQCTNKTLTTVPFGNTCKEDEVSPKVEEGVVAGLQCL
jgi:hypothetical protein